jgi:hypothetical protein
MNNRHKKHTTASFRRHWRRILVREDAGAHNRFETCEAYSLMQHYRDVKSDVLYAGENLKVRIPRSLRYLKKKELPPQETIPGLGATQ